MIEKYFSGSIGDPYEDPKNVIKYVPRNIEIKDDGGRVIEKLDGVIFPEFWSQNAANTVATKYFRRNDVPGTSRETDIRQLAKRVSKKISDWGIEQHYFDKDCAKILEEEIAASTLFQYGSFNSPVWFNLGLDIYNIVGGKSDSLFHIGKNDEVEKTENFYENPLVSACFISSPEDSIEDMIQVGTVISSRIFKRGAGIGGDWSKIRSSGEPISGGGYASGAVRFMDLQDSCGRVIKSGGTTRRAATMQSISVWHPDLLDILKHKYKEEEKARSLIKAGSPRNWESHTIQDLRAQNVNISIRIDDNFWKAYEEDKLYDIKRVIDKQVLKKESAKKILKWIAFATHNCGDPAIQNHTIINKYNTCPNSGEIWASNPCSEYMFLDESACNLASLNLMRFRKKDGGFDADSFCKAVDLYITAQDILVSKASYPTEKITKNSHLYRPLGLGYANLGAYIMSLGLSYDSNEARDFAAAVTSLMTAEAYLQSTRLAEKVGHFKEFQKNKDAMLNVIEMHADSAKKIQKSKDLEEIIKLCTKKWDEVIERGKEYGFRNAQVTLLAPTGTIGYMMDCDTNGCEPCFGLKQYKELAGGGSMMIINKTIPLALEKLGYSGEEIRTIVEYINNNENVEGCKTLKDEHLPIFDCASVSGKGGRYIKPSGHIKMLGAIQPHISGAISKTVNCPENTSVEDIEDMFYQAWKMGCKGITIYRDGSKAAQPLTTKKLEKTITILKRGEREPLNPSRTGLTQKVRIGGITLFLRTGEYEDGRLGEIFIDSLEVGSETHRQLNLNARQFSEKLQWGVPLNEAIDAYSKAGKSQIGGFIEHHPFIKLANGIEGFIYDFLRANYLGDISFVSKDPEMRPLPWELRIYQFVPELHLLPTIEGEKFYPGVPTLEEVIKKISGENYWKDEGMDTRETIEKIKKNRLWKNKIEKQNSNGVITGKICNQCGNMLIVDGTCWRCPSCRTSTGGCGG